MSNSIKPKNEPIGKGHVLFTISRDPGPDPVYSFKPCAEVAHVSEIKKLLDSPSSILGAWLGRSEGSDWMTSQISHIEEFENVDLKTRVYVVTTVDGYRALLAERDLDSFPMRLIQAVDRS